MEDRQMQFFFFKGNLNIICSGMAFLFQTKESNRFFLFAIALQPTLCTSTST